MIKLGCHVGNNGTDMLLGSVNEALSYNANSFMVYLGAPQNSFRKPISDLSRGCSIEDIVVTSAITLVQAGN